MYRYIFLQAKFFSCLLLSFVLILNILFFTPCKDSFSVSLVAFCRMNVIVNDVLRRMWANSNSGLVCVMSVLSTVSADQSQPL